MSAAHWGLAVQRRGLKPGPDGRDYSKQLTLAIGCLFGLQGIPCLYYGTEQGLQGTRELYAQTIENKPEHVREALWGKPNAFDASHTLYKEIGRAHV